MNKFEGSIPLSMNNSTTKFGSLYVGTSYFCERFPIIRCECPAKPQRAFCVVALSGVSLKEKIGGKVRSDINYSPLCGQIIHYRDGNCLSYL